MTAGMIDFMRGARLAGALIAGLLGGVGLCGSSLPAAAADTGQDILNVASLEQLPEASLRDERGGANTPRFIFSLHALLTVNGETKFSKDIPQNVSNSQTTTLVTNVTTTNINSVSQTSP
jgi:hypothetical protein